MLETHPELLDMGAREEAIAALESALREAWEALPDTLFESFIESMPGGLQRSSLQKDGTQITNIGTL
jgi:hypothetical protein